MDNFMPTPLSYYVDYVMSQQNGQMIFAPPSNLEIPFPPKGTELFIGNLPKDVEVEEILNIFSGIGPIFSVRLMVDFNNKGRGFGFVRFYYEFHAKLAIRQGSYYFLRDNYKIHVYRSIDNCRIYVRNIPREKSSVEVETKLKSIVDGVSKIFLYTEPTNPELNRGYAFVEFVNHRQAAIARRQLIAGGTMLWGNTIFVDWADPEPVVDDNVLQSVTILFLRNLPVDISTAQCKKTLKEILHIEGIIRVHKENHYAFVHFVNKELAKKGYEQLINDSFILEQGIEVEWARPANYSKKNRWETSIDHFCVSVPPYQRRMALKVKHGILAASKKQSHLQK